MSLCFSLILPNFYCIRKKTLPKQNVEKSFGFQRQLSTPTTTWIHTCYLLFRCTKKNFLWPLTYLLSFEIIIVTFKQKWSCFCHSGVLDARKERYCFFFKKNESTIINYTVFIVFIRQSSSFFLSQPFCLLFERFIHVEQNFKHVCPPDITGILAENIWFVLKRSLWLAFGCCVLNTPSRLFCAPILVFLYLYVILFRFCVCL